MAKLISIASGKGGVGKSFCSSSLALSLCAAGYKTLLVDADLGGANLHNFVGLKVPGVGLYNYIRERSELSDVIVKSPAGVDFIGGSGDVLGMAHITKFEKIKILTGLKNEDYEYVVLDLGAGTSFNMVDMFNVGDIKIVVMSGEPTSIENAYGFLKVAIYRHIERFLSKRWDFSEINKKLRSKSMNFPNVQSIIDAAAKIDENVAAAIRSFVSAFKPGMVLNQVKFKRELNVFYGFENVVNKYLSISIEKLGFLPYDKKVSECIKLLRPYYVRFPDSETVGCINDIRDQMIVKLQGSTNE
ncbi:MAG: P-loop NTPase [Deferribacterales bacterium]|nr:P-loop NTPase [Deferribacterales bacterium]